MPLLWRETRHAVRRLLRAPGFTLASVITLALGIGATTAVYSLVHSTVLRPLPYPDSERLVWIDHAAPGIGSERGLGLTPGLFAHYRETARQLEDIAAWEEADVTIAFDDPARVQAILVTPSFFRTLRVAPEQGRALPESGPGSAPVAVISHGLWQRRLGGDPGAVGRTVRIEGEPVEIAGVMPAGFAFPAPEVDVWLSRPESDPASFGGFYLQGIARLAPGAGLEAAEAELTAALPGLADRYDVQRMLDDTRLSASLTTLKEHVVFDARRTLWILLGSVVFVLLLACANVANLLLVRAEGRAREAAVRRALGAGRGEILRYFMAEGVLLAVAGGGLGLLIAQGAVRALVANAPAELPRLSEIAVRWPVLGAAVMVMLAAATLFGLAPALASRSGPASSIRTSGRGASGGRSATRGRRLLVGAQMALAVILMVATGLMSRSFLHLTRIDPGFDDASALTFEVGLTTTGYEDRAAAVALHREALDRLAALPGVEAVGATTCLPLCGSWAGTQLIVEGRPDDPASVPSVVAVRRASEGLFGALDIRLLAGRLPERGELESGPPPAVISAEAVARYWPDEDPLGRRFRTDSEGAWFTVVGVVEDTPIRALTDDPPPTVYLPLLDPANVGNSPYELGYVLETSVPPQSLVLPAREILRSLDPTVPMAGVATLKQIVRASNVSTAFTMVVLGLASTIALVLGLVGIYGVISYMVGRRSKEIGIRMALGARAGQVSASVLADGGRVAAAGLAVGLLGAIALTRFMRSLLVGVTPTDPLTYLSVAALLLGVALAATWLPARRAARVDPVTTLRGE